ncbi:ScbR family autoregulator-binding transcription factor [Streptomyces sp. NBC_01716]|uniref:ScbR family autoregulator-binding transcription factor n=1 Tax=Streptomyces sp. NBC_01716 TaxID=2975917 RepID=UPI002E375A2C|nr:ScbR family autoregulator-binding transcription factor [Streptomyces sp. NBC_01716]
MAQQDRAIRTRRSILEAAAAVFDERGYNSATVGEILTRAGVTKGALYFHFTSKEDLALGVLDAQLAIGPFPEQSSKLQLLVDQGMVLAHRLRHDPLVRASTGLALDQGALGINRGTPFESWVAQNEDMLRQAKEQGELLPHVNLRETAELFTGAFAGVQTMSHVLCDRADLDHRISVLLNHVLPSIAVPAVLARLDMAPDRGERIYAEIEALQDK